MTAAHAIKPTEATPLPTDLGQPLLNVEALGLEYSTPTRRVRATHDVSFDVFLPTGLCCLGRQGVVSPVFSNRLRDFCPPSADRLGWMENA